MQALYLGISLLNLNNSEGGLLDGQDCSRVGKLCIVHGTCCQPQPNMARFCLLLSVLIPYKSSLILLITNIYSWTPCTKGWVSLTFWYMYITWFVHICLPFPSVSMLGIKPRFLYIWGKHCITGLHPSHKYAFCGLFSATYVSVSVGEWFPKVKCCPVSLSARRPCCWLTMDKFYPGLSATGHEFSAN